MTTRHLATPAQDDHELELPPLDADEEREPDDEAGDAEDLGTGDADDLDDATADDLDIGGDDLDEPAPDEPGDREQDDLDASGLDVGPLDDGLVGEDDDLVSHDEGGLPSDDDDDLSVMDEGDDDGGAEGTGDPIEDEVDDGALPELDADDAGDFEEDDVGAELPEEVAAAPRWEPDRWVVCDGAGAVVPCRLVVAVDARVVAAGADGLLVVDDGARASRQVLPAGAAPVALAAHGDRVVVATSGGRMLDVWIGRSAGGRREPVALMGGWERGAVTGVVATPERLWIAADGGLYTLATGEGSAAGAPRLVKSGGVRAIAAAAGAVVALADVEGTRAILRFRSDDEPCSTAVLDGAVLEVARDEPVLLAAAGAHAVAVAGPRGLAVSRDGGVRFSTAPLSSVRAIAFAGDGDDSDLLALVEHEAEESAWLVRVTAAGACTRLGELRASDVAEEPLGDAAMAWDAGRETVWIASRVGLVALAKRPRH